MVVDVRAWTTYYIPPLYVDVITYQCITLEASLSASLMAYISGLMENGAWHECDQQVEVQGYEIMILENSVLIDIVIK